jgi:hypothetical protein
VADVFGEELLPGAVPDRVVRGEVAALAVAGERRPGKWIGWKLVVAGTGTSGSRARPRASSRISWWNWVARRIVHGRPESWISRSAWSLAW